MNNYDRKAIKTNNSYALVVESCLALLRNLEEDQVTGGNINLIIDAQIALVHDLTGILHDRGNIFNEVIRRLLKRN